MARTVRLDKLRGLARFYADQRPGGNFGFIPDTGGTGIASLTDLCNLALAELYDLLIRARGADYYSSSATISLANGTAGYALPPLFYQLQAVSLEWGARDVEQLFPLDRVTDRFPLVNDGTWGKYLPKGYRLRGSTQIEFVPTPTSAVTCRIHYVTTVLDLSADDSTFDGVNGWEKLVALRVAMELRAAEEMPYADLERLYEREKERIEAMASEREAAQPKQIGQVHPEGGVFVWPFTRRPLP